MTSKAQNTLVTTLFVSAIGLLTTIGACSATRLYARVDKIEENVNASTVTDAVLKKDIDDFHKATDLSFEYIKRLIERDLNEHHATARQRDNR